MLSDRNCLSVCHVLSYPVLSVTLLYCGQTAAWIKMPALGTEVGLCPGHIGGPAPPPPKGDTVPLPNFSSMFVVAKRLDGSRCHLVRW